MHLDGPERYPLTFNAASVRVTYPEGQRTFRGRACDSTPKLYVVMAAGRPVYVGITCQSLSARLRLGWRATGKDGYHGYKWRHAMTESTLLVWYYTAMAPGTSAAIWTQDMETVEAEVVFLIRQAGQWPDFQNEIHFHPSTAAHRACAQAVFAHFEHAPAGAARSTVSVVHDVR
jgi:hypothetical protein